MIALIAVIVMLIGMMCVLAYTLAIYALPFMLALAAMLHLVRLARWAGERSWRNPLLVILHVGYAFVPLGFALSAAASFGPIPVFKAGRTSLTLRPR